MKRDQSKYKYARDNWRKNNPDYHKKYYKEVVLIDEQKKKQINKKAKKWQEENKEKAYLNHKKYSDKNREKLNQKALIYRKEHREEYLETRRKYRKKKILENPNFLFSEKIRSNISNCFKRGNNNFKKPNSTEDILGCSIEFFINYILCLCPKEITIKDFHKFGYHLDHIIPVSTAKTVEEIIKVNHYTNFQPLWWKDNITKSNKILT